MLVREWKPKGFQPPTSKTIGKEGGWLSGKAETATITTMVPAKVPDVDRNNERQQAREAEKAAKLAEQQAKEAIRQTNIAARQELVNKIDALQTTATADVNLRMDELAVKKKKR